MRPGINLAKIRLVSLFAIALAGVAGLTACGGGGGGSTVVVAPPLPPPAAGTGITVFPGVASVPLGGKAVFTAYVPSAPTTTTFTWAVTGSGNGSITTDGTGKGDYVAPATAPAGAVTVTVTATVNSVSLGGSATVTISALPAGGVAVSPASISVAAGSTFQMTATANGAPATVTQWQVNGTANGDTLHGTIDANGNYTAPAMPPPGGSTTITAITAGGSASAATTVVFSNNSLSGPYTFAYTGDDGTAFLAAAGSFTATNGTLVGGEDASDTQATASSSISGVYAIGPDGRGTVTISGGPNGGETWRVALAANPSTVVGSPVQHMLLVRFDSTGTGSGTIDQQNTIEAATPFPSGNYVFGLAGLDHGGFTFDSAGKFFSNGSSTGSAAVWDVNDGGTAVTDDTTLTATFTTAASGFTGSVGRGVLTLFSTSSSLNTLTGQSPTSTFQFVFYVVDNTHLKIIENDGHSFLSGDVFSGPSTNDGAFTQAGVLKNGNYAFTLGGASTDGSYAAGGVFGVSGGNGTSTGVMDINNGGVQIPLDKTLSVTYGVDTNLGRITFTLTPTGGSSYSIAGYTTSSGSVEMVETDKLAVASGMAFPQTATGEPSGSFAANVSGIATKAAQEEDATAQLSIASAAITGTLDLNNVAVTGGVDPGLPLITGTTIVAPDTNGRGTITLDTSLVTYPVVYYMVNSKTVLLVGTNALHVVLGTVATQY